MQPGEVHKARLHTCARQTDSGQASHGELSVTELCACLSTLAEISGPCGCLVSGRAKDFSSAGSRLLRHFRWYSLRVMRLLHVGSRAWRQLPAKLLLRGTSRDRQLNRLRPVHTHDYSLSDQPESVFCYQGLFETT